MNKIVSIITITIFLFSLSSCKSETEKDIHELIKGLNSIYNYSFEYDDFTIEKRENIIYHIMTDNGSLLSLYSNKEKEIIQCTLSGFNINNSENLKIISEIGTILCNKNASTIKKMLDTAKTNVRCQLNGWNIAVIQNQNFTTYIINRVNSKLNNNQLPTLKNN